ncbi:SufE family protein [Kaistia dalseonensis]|uniref:Cysteine desulfuration protein SufE n=1 Tax=Kaistia dalseonensis TaxID=410840 RepID=A0ABU0HD59_9HYPH|nr:SufE family protein [Kaistia dalseonensis]MCX5497615.1 SufE family protein [Kaistia dalseonensis]MDQ0440257.1 cysteine desulfuration protein SufE [Kaistia dalseonensis]
MDTIVPVPPIERIIDDFGFLDDWEDRYRYLIELGRELAPLPPEAHNDANKVQGCASQVWLQKTPREESDGLHLDFAGDSDALIVRGLVAIVIALFSGRTPAEIMTIDAEAVFAQLGLSEHLTAQRSNGLRSMVSRIKTEAAAAA